MWMCWFHVNNQFYICLVANWSPWKFYLLTTFDVLTNVILWVYVHFFQAEEHSCATKHHPVVSVTLEALKSEGRWGCSCFFHLGKKLQSEGIPQWEQTDHRGALLSMGLSTPRLPESLSQRGSPTCTHTLTRAHTLNFSLLCAWNIFSASLKWERIWSAYRLEFPQLI